MDRGICGRTSRCGVALGEVDARVSNPPDI